MSEVSSSRAPSVGQSGFMAVTALVAMLALIVAGFGAFIDDDEDDGAAGSGGTVELEVTLSEMKIDPPTFEVDAGTTIVAHVTNSGAIAHDFKWNGEVGTKELQPNQSETVEIGPITESGAAWCTVPGHREAGMEMAITVKGAAGGGGGGGAAVAPRGDLFDFNAAAAPEDFEARDPVAPTTPAGTVHKITLETVETEIAVGVGKDGKALTQKLWTFALPGEEATVPGPVLRGKVGDRFEITLVNKGEIDHSIDFHASKVAWNKEMASIKPGESKQYNFEAKHSGIFMYHCGTPPALHHIGNGMHGAIIIDPPNLPAVDKEYVLVQSEFYTGDPGKEGDLSKMLDDRWDAVTFNGYANQYKYAPIRVEPDERVRVWVLDTGPSENSSFHVVGTIFDTVYKEGGLRIRPGDGTSAGAQAIDLQPAQGGYVEFTFDVPGLYPIVTHKFSNVAKGALGLFQAGEVEASGGGH